MIEEIMKIYKKKGFKTMEALSNRNSLAFKIWKKLGAKESKDSVMIRWKL